MLGLAGSNSVNPQPAVRIACTDRAYNVKTKHAVIKRLTDPWAASDKHPKTRMYERDERLMQMLNDYVSQLDPPYPNPEGKGTNRVPVRLLSNRPEEIVTMRRKMQTGPQLKCECAGWRPKTQEEAVRDGLPWPPPQEDRERYFVSLPAEGMGATWYEYDDQFRIKATRQILCNPMKCPYAGGFVAKKQGEAKPCKPETEINCQLGDWGGGELCFVHAESWATAQRFNMSLAVIFQACGGNVAGIEVDVCLEYTKAQSVPGGSKTRHPYWVLAIPYGMSETEFRARAIARRQALLADVTEMARLAAMTQQLLGESQLSWRRGALLPEFQPNLKALPEATADRPDDWYDPQFGGSEVDQAAEVLEQSYGMAHEDALLMGQANREDLAAMFERLGPPPVTQEPDPGPPVIEGKLEDDAPPVPDDDQAVDVTEEQLKEWEDEYAPSPEAEPATPPVPKEAPVAPAPVPAEVADAGPPDLQLQSPPASPPEPTVPPMFPSRPASCFKIEDRFAELGEQEDFAKIVSATWKKVTGTARDLVPSPGTTNSDAELLERLTKTLLQKAEGWWAKIGYEKHGAEGDAR
jgi:hypothetical protein